MNILSAIFFNKLVQRIIANITISWLRKLAKNTKNTLDDTAVDAIESELKKAGLV